MSVLTAALAIAAGIFLIVWLIVFLIMGAKILRDPQHEPREPRWMRWR